MKTLFLALLLLCTLSTSVLAEKFEFQEMLPREIVGELLKKMGTKLEDYEGGDEVVSFSFEGSPEQAFKAFLKENGMRARMSSSGMWVKYFPPLPEAVLEALESGEEFKLYSIVPQNGPRVDPKLVKGTAYGYDCLGEVELSPEEREFAREALLASIEEGFDFARCFLPRHILTIDDSTVMVICFQCRFMKVSDKTGKSHKVLLGEDHGLTRILDCHGIPLAPGY